MPCYFEYEDVSGLLKQIHRKDLNGIFRITRINRRLIRKLLRYHHYNLLIPFAQKVTQFTQTKKPKDAIKRGQFNYVKRLFQNPTFIAEVTDVLQLYRND